MKINKLITSEISIARTVSTRFNWLILCPIKKSTGYNAEKKTKYGKGVLSIGFADNQHLIYINVLETSMKKTRQESIFSFIIKVSD